MLLIFLSNFAKFDNGVENFPFASFKASVSMMADSLFSFTLALKSLIVFPFLVLLYVKDHNNWLASVIGNYQFHH